MSQLEYIFAHCWMTGWQNMRGSFRIWRDLMMGRYEDYALMWYDDPFEECVSWFWGRLGDDDTLPKEFLEHLYKMADEVKNGKVELIPFDQTTLDELEDLVEEFTDETPEL